MVWTVGRYAVSGTDDVAGANALQDGTTLTPLSTFSGTPAPAQPSAYPKLTRDDLTDPKAFFTTLNEMLRRNPPPPRDAGLMALFGEIGLAPEQRFDWDTLSEPAKAGLTRAARDGLAIINDRIANYSDVINGWSVAILDADMSDRPVDHAAAARLGLLYSQKEVSTYHVSLFDADSKPLDGTNSYELRFAPIPPVNAFWSVTMYDGTTKILIDNPINRYSVGDRTPGLIYGNDDKTEIVITISNTEPTDATARANWLPAPKGPFYLTLREYSPAPAILTRDWVPPAIHKVE